MNQMSEVEKAYIAGLMDGEGCITIMKSSPKRRSISFSYRVAIEIGMTDGGQMEYCQRVTGLGYITRAKVHSRLNCRDRWQWTIPKDGVYELLPQIYPYLVLKKPQAALALEFISMVGVPRKSNRIDPVLQKQKEEYYLAIKQLKYMTGDVIDWPEVITLEVVNKVFEDRSLLHQCFISDKESENVCEQT
jgi:hypothetical protein